MTTTNIPATQKINTLYFCEWTAGAKKYFKTLDGAIAEAEKMYERSAKMSDENYAYWLTQKQLIGIETTIETSIFETSK